MPYPQHPINHAGFLQIKPEIGCPVKLDWMGGPNDRMTGQKTVNFDN
jgi:hypothetical protein